jgi:hypothetical protein
MKALQRLDFVMLWVARIFAIGFLVWTFPKSLPSNPYDPIPSLAVAVTWVTMSALWVACTWCLRRDIARLYLMLSSILPLISALSLQWVAFSDHGTISGFGRDGYLAAKVVSIVFVFGFVSMIWVGFRPPRKVRSTPPDSTVTKKLTSQRPDGGLFSVFLRHWLPRSA